MANDESSSKNGRSRKGLLGWLRIKPGPAPAERSQRVHTTPPSDGPSSAYEMLRLIVDDIDAVLENDPAARHALEVISSYPGLHALWMHRVAHGMWTRGWITGPRLLAHMNRFLTGIEIHPGARIGRHVFIDHGMGIVIGETATVGDGCLLYKGVVLGGTSLERRERHPTLGQGVVVGTNACILGPIHVGDYAKVGSNSVVIRDVPENATVVGVPGRAMESRSATRSTLDHANLPDPVAVVVEGLIDEIEELRRRVDELSKGGAPAPLGGRAHEHAEFEND